MRKRVAYRVNGCVPMCRRYIAAMLILLSGVTVAIGKEAEAANEDVPEGPGYVAPGQPTPPRSDSQRAPPSTGSVNAEGKKSVPSGGGDKGPGPKK